MTIFAVDTCSLIALLYSGHLEAIFKNMSKPTGEEELIELALHKKCDFIVSDDLRALSNLTKAGIPVIFSTHLLYYLYRKGIISKDDSMIALEKMRNRRSWKENLIYITGKTLFE